MSTKEKIIFKKSFNNIMEAFNNLEYEEARWSASGLRTKSKILNKGENWIVKIKIDED